MYNAKSYPVTSSDDLKVKTDSFVFPLELLLPIISKHVSQINTLNFCIIISEKIIFAINITLKLLYIWKLLTAASIND